MLALCGPFFHFFVIWACLMNKTSKGSIGRANTRLKFFHKSQPIGHARPSWVILHSAVGPSEHDWTAVTEAMSSGSHGPGSCMHDPHNGLMFHSCCCWEDAPTPRLELGDIANSSAPLLPLVKSAAVKWAACNVHEWIPVLIEVNLIEGFIWFSSWRRVGDVNSIRRWHEPKPRSLRFSPLLWFSPEICFVSGRSLQFPVLNIRSCFVLLSAGEIDHGRWRTHLLILREVVVLVCISFSFAM